MFSTSEQTDKIDQALAKAQGEFGVVDRDSKNPHYKSTYASLASYISVIRPAFAKYGLSLTQHPLPSEPGKLNLQTRIAHDGQWIMSVCSAPLSKQDIQGWGGALTYAKRYAIAAILNLADDDDDGETAMNRTKPEASLAAVKKTLEDDTNSQCQFYGNAISNMLSKIQDNETRDKVVHAVNSAGRDFKELKRIAEKLRWMIEQENNNDQ